MSTLKEKTALLLMGYVNRVWTNEDLRTYLNGVIWSDWHSDERLFLIGVDVRLRGIEQFNQKEEAIRDYIIQNTQEDTKDAGSGAAV